MTKNMTRLNDLLVYLNTENIKKIRLENVDPETERKPSQNKIKIGEKEAIFLAKCLMSHLQTGCSLLLTDAVEVPKVTDHQLALARKNPFVPGSLPYRVFWIIGNFLNYNENYHSALSALNALNDSSIFYPGLSLQTLSMDAKGYMSLDELLKSPCAPSVIDISRRKVRQLTRFAGEHSRGELQVLMRDFTEQNSGCGGRSRLKTVLGSDASAFINEFFDQFLCDIDEEEAYIKSTPDAITIFKRHLHLRGALATKILRRHEHLKAEEDKDKLLDPSVAHQWIFSVGSSGSGSNNPKSSKESDLKIVLNQAEQFHPGISNVVGPFNS